LTVPAQSQAINVLDHPAALAWRQLNRGGVPVAIERVGRARRRAKSALWRLVGGSPSGHSVIAKQSRAATIAVESCVYLTVLGPLGVTLPKCYGHVDCGDGTAWLFLDEVCGARYSEQNVTHRRAASAWLGQMHAVTNKADSGRDLVPAVTLERYQLFLESALANMSRHIGPQIPSDAQSALSLATSAVARLQMGWPKVRRAWCASPICLVHGDFIGKNVILDERDGRCDIHVLDWEASGRGVPAEDLAGLAVSLYASHASGMWDGYGREHLDTLANIGDAFRAVAFLSNYSKALNMGWFGDAAEIAHQGSVLAATLDQIAL